MKTKDLIKQLKDAKANLEAHKSKRLAASSAAPSVSTASIEQKAMSKFGVKTLNELIKLNTADRRFKAHGAEVRESVKTLKEAVDVSLMCAARFGIAVQHTKAYEEMVQPALKAFGIDSGDQGYAWIPTMISDSYIDEYNLERKVAGLFTEVKMPSNPYQYPVLSNGAIANKLGENTALSPSQTFSTSSITFTAVKLSNQYELPEELQEDSAVDVMKVIRQELIEGQEKAMEIAILEGDTAVTHQHTNTQIPGATGVPTAGSSERVFDGLRKRCLASSGALTVNCAAAPINESLLASARKKLGKFGVNPAELAMISGVRVYTDLQQLDDVRTLEQYGPQATVLSGELAKYEGMPVVVSEYLREDTDATGINGATANNNIKSSILIVNRKRWFTGLRRAIQIRVENNRTAYDTWDMVSFSRRAFQGVLASNAANAASESSAVLLFNIA